MRGRDANTSRRSYTLIALLLTGLCGCGSTATVSGKVLYKGRPVTYGSVIIQNADKTAHSGPIEPDGPYTVEGVRPGDVKIGVISRDPSRDRFLQRRDAAAAKLIIKNWFPLPHKLEDPNGSGLTCTVGSGQVNYDIDLGN